MVEFILVNLKLFNADKIREGDVFTLKNEPISSIDLMERAAKKCAAMVLSDFADKSELILLCGTGNNGGDGLVIARVLSSYFSAVHVFCIGDISKANSDFHINLEKIHTSKASLYFVQVGDSLESLNILLKKTQTVLGDALFGTGLNKSVTDSFYSELFRIANASAVPVFSVDIPSGMFADNNKHILEKGEVIKATKTYSFEQPKLSFLFAENYIFTGKVSITPIGIHPEFKIKNDTENYVITETGIKNLLISVNPFSHKGTFGHALLIGGSVGKSGAMTLCSRACVRSGAGLTSILVPEVIIPILQSTVPEAMCIAEAGESLSEKITSSINNYSSLGIGPGLGTEKESQQLVKKCIAEFQGAKVLDADALNILSENKTWLSFLNYDTILTPHPKEFDRLTSYHETGFERWKSQVEFSKKYGVYVILKGAYTQVTTPLGKTFFNSSGNPGMATGGSGDVLTGLLTALLAQGYRVVDACLLGVYLHGLAGDFAFREKGREGMNASDIIAQIPNSFIHITD